MVLDVARKSCFVVAPYDLPLGRFLEVLRKEQIEPFFISDFLKRGGLAISNVRSAFRSVDLVIGLLVQGRALDNVCFEIGMAVGLGRPVLLFSSIGMDLPVDLAGLQVNYVDFTNLESTIPTIKKRLEPKEKGKSVDEFVGRSGAPERGRPRLRGAALRDELQKIRNIWAHSQDSRQLESELTRLLTEVGWTVAEARPTVRNRAPDLAVWIDEVQKDIGNPIAVEIKLALTPRDLDVVVARLSSYLSSAGAKAGIVFYGGPNLELNRNVAQSSPPIFAFSFDQLAELIEDERSFEKGRKLEEVIAYVFGKVPGVKFYKSNIINNAGSEEVDVAFFNGKQRGGLPFLEYFLLVECKNWSSPVGAIHVREFATKLKHRACPYGVLVAANGITGIMQDRTAALQKWSTCLN